MERIKKKKKKGKIELGRILKENKYTIFEFQKVSLSKQGKIQNLDVKKNFICMRIKSLFISMALHLASLWNRGLRQLKNGLKFVFTRVVNSYANSLNEREFLHEKSSISTGSSCLVL